MKKTFSILIVLFVSLTIAGFTTSDKLQGKKVVATYTEFTDNGQFMFTDANNKQLLFDEVSEDVEIDLYDDAKKKKKFTITWEEEEVEVYDEEGEPTGDMQTIRRITALEEA